MSESGLENTVIQAKLRFPLCLRKSADTPAYHCNWTMFSPKWITCSIWGVESNYRILGKQTLLHSEKSSNDSFVFRERQNRLDPKQMGFCHLQRPLGKRDFTKTEWENEQVSVLLQGNDADGASMACTSVCQKDLLSEMNSIEEATLKLRLQTELNTLKLFGREMSLNWIQLYKWFQSSVYVAPKQ